MYIHISILHTVAVKGSLPTKEGREGGNNSVSLLLCGVIVWKNVNAVVQHAHIAFCTAEA